MLYPVNHVDPVKSLKFCLSRRWGLAPKDWGAPNKKGASIETPLKDGL